tara:strand:- start:944 stop:1186 length:243 start_codon:yes stop_codon:yes gene_type:complete
MAGLKFPAFRNRPTRRISGLVKHWSPAMNTPLDFFRLNGGDAFSHQMDRARSRAGVRRRASNHDVNAFFAGAGIKARKTR